MMECNYVIPILYEVLTWVGRNIDQSLIRYFATKTLGMVGPPFTREFLLPFLQILSQLSDRSLGLPDYVALLVPFLRHCHNTNYGLDVEEKGIISALLEKCK
eukprot:TRINITY_DN3314_c0_g1_i4.p1 TRINITY_DN3314_c0_g1~~TRINITY_DN3314_c0_g1_i4.p1  ORF type:complete len:102 (+),score=7.60 TRINITY_DN3314_c0_g1_i4:1164-1469(+)